MNKSLAVVAVVAALLVAGGSAGLIGGLLNLGSGATSSGGLLSLVGQATTSTLGGLGQGATQPNGLVNLTPPTDDQVNQTLTDLVQFVYGSQYLTKLITPEALVNTVTTFGKALAGLLAHPDADSILDFLFAGFVLGSGEYQNNVGVLGLPTYTLCPLGLQYKLTSCVICNQDCQVAHNAIGGKCGKSPIGTHGDTCLCAYTPEDAAARNIVANSSQTCEAYNPIVPVEDKIIGAAFRIRFVVQCLVNGTDTTGAPTYDNTGCNADCSLNHGSPGGECLMQYPLVHNAATSDEKNLYCICKNADGSLGSGTSVGPAGPPTS